MSRLAATLERLEAVIASRRGADPTQSWSARLIAEPALAARKVAEEAVELALAAVLRDTPAVTSEAADLIYHILALLTGAGVGLDDVAAVLEAREGRSGVDEKASRMQGG
ncbi:MAG: phosphoribosyl-ATP diphosphatase [Caulobacteraceae bacterium]|nr:phosphoribosyl-ATP diphosphatase [Caulobacteraceae bacterium]